MPKKILMNFLKHQSFQPSIFSLVLNPFYFIRRSLFVSIRKMATPLQGKLLDFGCGRKPYEDLFRVKEYIGLDLEDTGHDHAKSKVDVFYDGKTIPFADGTFDSLFCSEVFEHVFNPDEILPEINRVLKIGARALITVPFCWNEHETPYDYARYSSFGISALLQKHGFKVVELKKSGNFARVLMQLCTLYVFESFTALGRIGYPLSMIFIIPLNIIGIILLLILPRNRSMYFNSVILAEKVSHEQ